MKRLKKIAMGLLAVLATGTMMLGASCSALENLGISPDLLDKLGLGGGQSTETSDSVPDEKEDGTQTPEKEEYEVITIAEALELCGEEGNITTERYYLRGIVQSITNSQYGAMVISDDTGTISVYGTYSADGSIGYAEMAEKPYKGDEVLLHCILQNYNGTKEVKNARLIEFVSNQGNVDETAYTEMSIAEAKAAEEGAKVKVDGVVARITYANGMKPNGVLLVDETQSIYVFDGDLAGRVQVGNQVTILANKTYWVLEKEQAAADKHGYKGCNQLADVILVSNDEGNHEYDKDWITESTVKEIVDNPVSNDITSTIYKVNALVKEVPGKDFTNYYFFDIDGETGSYAYSQCSGDDFEWVRKFDGKICTVYLTALNAKSSDSACFYRFLPVEIVDEGYAFNQADAAKFAVEYYGVDQFAETYMADPALVLTNEVSSQLLGIEGVTVSYESSDTYVLYFETVDGVTTMHCATETVEGETEVVGGTAVVTVKAVYGEYEYSENVTVNVKKPVKIPSITVAEAIEATVDSTVTVRGIVGPSVVNKNGFYLFGDDGSMIAVLVDSMDAFADLEIGHKVVLEGMRERYVKDDTAAYAGQSCIVNAKILLNNYGSHKYSTEKFVTDKTLADFDVLDGTVDYSTTAFILKATVNYVETPYYTSLDLTWKDEDGNVTKASLYMANAGQYDFLAKFAGQEVTMEIAACNWNDKSYWRGCILAVYTEDGKILNELNFNTVA